MKRNAPNIDNRKMHTKKKCLEKWNTLKVQFALHLSLPKTTLETLNLERSYVALLINPTINSNIIFLLELLCFKLIPLGINEENLVSPPCDLQLRGSQAYHWSSHHSQCINLSRPCFFAYNNMIKRQS
jgi:hypothetical protein